MATTRPYEAGHYGNRFMVCAPQEAKPPTNASGRLMAICDSLEDAQAIANALNAAFVVPDANAA
jgi:hypothetical protein